MVVTENAHNVSCSQVSEIRLVAAKKKKKLNVPQNTKAPHKGGALSFLPCVSQPPSRCHDRYAFVRWIVFKKGEGGLKSQINTWTVIVHCVFLQQNS